MVDVEGEKREKERERKEEEKRNNLHPKKNSRRYIIIHR